MLPVGFLSLIIGPLLSLLYSREAANNPNPEITIMVIGHQWYWSYNYTILSLSTINTHQLTN